MADRHFLTVRAVGAPANPEAEVPSAPTGFTRVETTAIGVFRGEQLVWTAPYGRAELRALGRVIARAALVGPPRLTDADADAQMLDRCYRALLDYFFSGAGAANLLVIELRDEQRPHVDILWRLALALDGRLSISETGNGVHLELIGHGRRAELSAAIAARPHVLIKTLFSEIGSLFGARQRTTQQTLAVLVRDVLAPVAPVKPRVPVQFAELSGDEVREHPRRFGVGLVAAADGLGGRNQFVGRVNGRVIFQIACRIHAPVLQLLPPDLRSALVEPIALLTEAHTEIEFRNRSIFAAGLHWVAEWAANRGIRTLVTLILVDNAPSLRGSAKAGFRRIGELTLPR